MPTAIVYNYTNKTIDVDGPATVRHVYSDAMSVFAQADQMDDLVPLRADTPTLFTLINGWTFTEESIPFLFGAALQDATGDNVWTNVQTLGSIVEGTELYIEQDGAVSWRAPAPGHVDFLLATKVAGDEIDGQDFTVYARKFQCEYSSFSTTGGPFVANCPLATKADSNLTMDTNAIQALTPPTVAWGTFTKDAGDGQGNKTYHISIDAEGNTLKALYNYIQMLLQSGDPVDGENGMHFGNITPELIAMAGSTVITKQGVWVENFDLADANNIRYVDSTGTSHTPPLEIALIVSTDSAMNGGQAVVYQLDEAYDPATYTPANIVATLLAAAIANGKAQTSMEYAEDVPVLIRTRKAGRKPFEVATTLTSAGLSVASINEPDTIYQA